MYKGGQSGWGNLDLPNPYLVDQTQKYPLGTRYVEGYCSFYYTYLQVATCGLTLSTGAGGMGVIAENVPFTLTIVTATTGTSSIVATVASVTANQFAGGWINLYEVGVIPRVTTYRVESNTATDDPVAGQAVFTLSRPLIATYTAGATCRALQDPYSNVRFCLSTRTSSATFETCVGVWSGFEDSAGTAVLEGDYGWVQTWGPAFTCAAIAFEGANAFERDAFYHGGGGFQVRTSTTNPGYQRVGFILPASCADPGVSTTGSNIDSMEHVIWLQIQP